MPIIRIKIPLYLPAWLYHSLKRVFFGNHKKQLSLWGDRDVEWSFVSANMPRQGGKALDFGSGNSYMSLLAAFHGFRVIALDLEAQNFPWQHSMANFVQGDLFKMDFPKNYFDLIINCSTIEHVGLVGRYSVKENHPDGDLEAMAYLKQLMKPDGVMLLTIPVGQAALFTPLCRVYGRQRLPHLLAGYIVEKEVFWVKDSQNHWVLCDKETTLNFAASVGSWDALQNVYALGCFVLRTPSAEE